MLLSISGLAGQPEIALASGGGATAGGSVDGPLFPSDLFAPPPQRGMSLGGKLLGTGGVTTVEGSAGGGIASWALVGSYASRDEVGVRAAYTHIRTDDYHLGIYGVQFGLFDRVELSVARQRLDTEAVGAELGLGRNFQLAQTVAGVKVRLIGDAVLDQDRWYPQLALGVQYKQNDEPDLVRAIGADSHRGVDVYLAASKLFLRQALLVNATVRATRANQLGLLGFGGTRGYRPQVEGGLALLLRHDLAIGAEFRSKPDNLAIARETDWWDLFVAWFPTKHVSLTLAYADLGNIVLRDDQNAAFLSLQIGF